MTAEDRAKVEALLTDPYYVNVKARFDSGELHIRIDPPNWRESQWTDPYWRISVPLALSLSLHLPTADNFIIGYFADQDFQHIQFDFDGDTYIVQWYKVYVLYRKSDGKQINFAFRYYDIPTWLATGKHKTSPHWYDGGKSLAPPFKHFDAEVTDT
jgi:hypothetical protein